jgi:hypothetical protein
VPPTTQFPVGGDEAVGDNGVLGGNGVFGGGRVLETEPRGKLAGGWAFGRVLDERGLHLRSEGGFQPVEVGRLVDRPLRDVFGVVLAEGVTAGSGIGDEAAPAEDVSSGGGGASGEPFW